MAGAFVYVKRILFTYPIKYSFFVSVFQIISHCIGQMSFFFRPILLSVFSRYNLIRWLLSIYIYSIDRLKIHYSNNGIVPWKYNFSVWRGNIVWLCNSYDAYTAISWRTKSFSVLLVMDAKSPPKTVWQYLWPCMWEPFLDDAQ